MAICMALDPSQREFWSPKQRLPFFCMASPCVEGCIIICEEREASSLCSAETCILLMLCSGQWLHDHIQMFLPQHHCQIQQRLIASMLAGAQAPQADSAAAVPAADAYCDIGSQARLGRLLPVPVFSLRRSSSASESSTSTTSSLEGAKVWTSRSQTASRSEQFTL